MTIDLESYFERIDYHGDRTATLETLRGIHLAHTKAIPFENLNPFLHLPVLLDAESLQRKLVSERRGGYCFEQNLLLSHALEALGFRVTGLAARVMWTLPEDAITPRSHMLLRVDIGDEPYLADVGFGGLTLTGPLRFALDVEQETPHEPFRLIEGDQSYVMQAFVGGAWRSLYRFTLERQFLADYQVTNWYLSNHPESRFVVNLVAARVATGRRYALRNHELAVHELHGATTRRPLTSATELRETLERVFGISVPKAADADAALARVLTLQPV